MSFIILFKKLHWLLFGCVISIGVIEIGAKIIAKSFDADINPDPKTSSYQENYITLNTYKASGQSYDELTYCFRWRLKYSNTQCLFWEKSIGFAFTSPIRGFGFLMINGVNFMFRVQDGIQIVPYTWYSICVVYQANNNHIKVVLDDYIVLNDSFDVLSNLTSNKVILGSTFELGNCRKHDPTGFAEGLRKGA